MQSLHWYYHRLRRMGVAEILWRGRGTLREAMDLVRFPLGFYPAVQAPAPLATLPVAFTFATLPNRLPEASLDRLRAQADRILDHRLSFFQHDDLYLGDPIDWHRDWNQQLGSPRAPCPLVDYRNAHLAGDCKQVWEPNRHHQIYVLARAWHQLRDARYAAGAMALFTSWLEANPFGHGMNWKNPLELGVRVINWVFALDLLRDAPWDDALWQRLHNALHLHVWDLSRKFSRGSSANNHLVGEAAGAFVAASWLRHLPRATQVRDMAQAILVAEIGKQFNGDGGTSEQAIGYQFFSLQFFTLCALVADRIGRPMPPAYAQRLRDAYAFLEAFAEGGSELPFYGDKDDGYVLDCGDHSHDVRAVVALASVLFGGRRASVSEAAFWLLGAAVESGGDPPAGPLASRAFADSGQYLLQSGAGEDRLSVQVDCAPLGYGSIAAHGHADALSFTVRQGGLLMLVDPGTYDYYTRPDWRDAFRHTRAHNTVCVDDLNQSELLGAFLWGRQARATCLSWEDEAGTTCLRGRHDGYAALPDPVAVERLYRLDKDRRTLEIEDVLQARSTHGYAAGFHFHPECSVEVVDNLVTARRCGQRLTIRLPAGVRTEVFHGDERAMLGWFSDGYHRKTPATAVVVKAPFSGQTTWRYSIRMESAAGRQAEVAAVPRRRA